LILIGSRALSLRLGSAMFRPCVDFDFVCTKAEFDTWLDKNRSKVGEAEVYELPEHNKWIVKGQTAICEFDIIQPGSSNELLVDLVKNDPETLETPFGAIPNLDVLWATKDSHKFRKFNEASGFWKTAIDWHMMKKMGAKMRPEYEAYSNLRQQESYAAQKHPKLNVSKDAFFKDDGLADTYIWDHDDIHNVVKLYDRPAYTYYLADNEEVKCSKDKFFSVSEDVRLAGGLEEGLTLSLERSYIPNKGVWEPDYIFKYALGKVASTITSGFFRNYVFSNIFDILKLYKQTSTNYCEKFDAALAAGKVRPFAGSKY
jgi:hypothetical protein